MKQSQINPSNQNKKNRNNSKKKLMMEQSTQN